MRHWTITHTKFFKNPPAGITIEMYGDNKHNPMFWVTFDMDNLEHVNFVRVHDENPKKPLPHLKGYCMSTGCSCRHANGSKGRPDCGLFKCYEADGIKKDFIHQLLGI